MTVTAGLQMTSNRKSRTKKPKPRTSPNWGGDRRDPSAPPPRERLTFRVTADAKRQLKDFANQENTTAAALVSEAVDFG